MILEAPVRVEELRLVRGRGLNSKPCERLAAMDSDSEEEEEEDAPVGGRAIDQSIFSML